MPLPSFTDWLQDRPPEFPDIGTLALVIAQSGTAGVSLDELRKVIGSSAETLEPMLRALVVSRQVVVVQVGGEWRYRAAT
jgi:hypothetical protein